MKLCSNLLLATMLASTAFARDVTVGGAAMSDGKAIAQNVDKSHVSQQQC